MDGKKSDLPPVFVGDQEKTRERLRGVAVDGLDRDTMLRLKLDGESTARDQTVLKGGMIDATLSELLKTVAHKIIGWAVHHAWGPRACL